MTTSPFSNLKVNHPVWRVNLWDGPRDLGSYSQGFSVFAPSNNNKWFYIIVRGYRLVFLCPSSTFIPDKDKEDRKAMTITWSSFSVDRHEGLFTSLGQLTQRFIDRQWPRCEWKSRNLVEPSRLHTLDLGVLWAILNHMLYLGFIPLVLGCLATFNLKLMSSTKSQITGHSF